MSRHCYVVGCSNGDYRIKLWKSVKCTTHLVYQGDLPCDCPQPFILYPFPGAVRDPEGQYRWKKAINRADPNKLYTFLEPTQNMVVCSHHFVGGKKTIDNPDPELHLIEKANKRPVQDKSGHERKEDALLERNSIRTMHR
ncbi:hypothetical protein LSH36_679g01012 [Paralvinella palmiformis]|uniref:THAP-type domain-containing protein n=1 Tax=Paralvinella palmiformis TaxID=53620 RepID=A0AAD9MVB8_9ANNE|nr:hypothetical protein LSH36_679g01012 [Paralvinella palmiformis]